MLHRGRFQAQGEKLEASVSWAKENPPSKNEGLSMLEELQYKIQDKEAEIRKSCFEKAKKFVLNGPYEVIDKPIKKTFKAPNTIKERLDIEILKGKAFI